MRKNVISQRNNALKSAFDGFNNCYNIQQLLDYLRQEDKRVATHKLNVNDLPVEISIVTGKYSFTVQCIREIGTRQNSRIITILPFKAVSIYI